MNTKFGQLCILCSRKNKIRRIKIRANKCVLDTTIFKRLLHLFSEYLVLLYPFSDSLILMNNCEEHYSTSQCYIFRQCDASILYFWSKSYPIFLYNTIFCWKKNAGYAPESLLEMALELVFLSAAFLVKSFFFWEVTNVKSIVLFYTWFLLKAYL